MLDVISYEKKTIIDSKLSPHSECCILFFLGGGVILRRLNFMCRRFGTLLMFHLMAGTPPINMEQTGCPEKLAQEIQKPGKHPKERIHKTIVILTREKYTDLKHFTRKNQNVKAKYI